MEPFKPKSNIVIHTTDSEARAAEQSSASEFTDSMQRYCLNVLLKDTTVVYMGMILLRYTSNLLLLTYTR